MPVAALLSANGSPVAYTLLGYTLVLRCVRALLMLLLPLQAELACMVLHFMSEDLTVFDQSQGE